MRTNHSAAPVASEGRVYLLHPMTITRGDGSKVLYPAGYYSLELEAASVWLQDGRAIREAEREAQLAAPAAPVVERIHPAGPKGAPATIPAAAPAEGKTWPHGPKDPKGSPTPAVAAATPAQVPQPAAVQTPAVAAPKIEEYEE